MFQKERTVPQLLGVERVARLDHRHHAGLGVERVEHRLDQDEIGAALDQRVDLLAGARVIGNVKAARITIAEGAQFKGNVDMDV